MNLNSKVQTLRRDLSFNAMQLLLFILPENSNPKIVSIFQRLH